MPAPTYRFDVAFSFAGTHRERVRAIAGIVQEQLGQEAVFYDEWFEDELGGDDADVLLQNCYEKQSLMVVADVSEDYAGRRWPQAEARAIRALRMTIDTARDEISRLRLAYIRFAEGDVPGVHTTAIFWDAATNSDKQLADLILSRLRKLKQGIAFQAPSPQSTLPPSRFQLPPVKPGFTGRETDLTILRDLASKDDGAATVITGLGGMGGIGKSELAKVLAHEWRPRFPDAQLWLDGYGTRIDPPPPSACDLIAQVIRAFRPQAGQLPEDLAALQRLYHQILAGKRALVVLDNAAHPEVADQAGALLPPEGCGLIITSRRSFLVGGKAPHLVGRLPEPEAIALLRELCPDLAVSDAAEVAARCGGLPLALRLAGAHFALDGASAGSVAAYVAALRGGRLTTLDADAADAGEVTIQETLRLSVDSLPAVERAAWLRLGVFGGDFDAAAATAVAGDMANPLLLGRLVRRNLLERDTAAGGGDRYRLHDLAADYARDRLAADEGENARDASYLAHAKHYGSVGKAADRLYLAGDPVSGLVLFDRERIQMEAAFVWVAAHPNIAANDSALISLVNGVANTVDLRFHPHQRIEWLKAQAAAANRLGHRKTESYALGNLGCAYRHLGDIGLAIAHHREALVINCEIDDRRGEANSFINLGLAHAALGEARNAIMSYDKALEISRELADRRTEGTALGNLGSAHLQLGDTGRAVGYFEGQLTISREFGDRRSEGVAHGNLGNAYARLGEVRQAIESYELALIIAREIGDRRSEGNCLGNLGIVHRMMGDPQCALLHYSKQLEIVREIGDRRGEANALGNLGTAFSDLDAPRRAIDYYQQQLQIVREIGDRRGESNSLWNVALDHERLGERGTAIELAEAALSILEAIEDPDLFKVRAAITEWRGE